MNSHTNTKIKKSLLIVFALVVSASSKSHSFKRASLKTDSDNLSKDQFTDLTYEDYTALQKSIIIYDQLVREYTLEKMFRSLEPQLCGEAECQTKMYQITNHNLGESEIKELPTILLVAGMHGTETLGVRGLTSFITLMQKIYYVQQGAFKVLNNIRILVVPVLNMEAFYNQRDFENVVSNKSSLKVDPNFDFNLNPRDKCFSSLSSQLLHKLFQEYLVLGTLLFTKGDFTIEYPQLTHINGSNQLYAEEKLLNKIAGSLQLAFHLNRKLDEVHEDDYYKEFFEDDASDIKDLEIVYRDREKIQRDIGNTSSGKYIHWAFGGSEEKNRATKTCLAKSSSFSKENIIPSNHSNRAIALEISFDKDKVRNLETNWGNELGCVDIDHEDAKFGVVPGMFFLIRRFIHIMRPFVVLDSIKVDSETFDTGTTEQTFEFKFDVMGMIFNQNSSSGLIRKNIYKQKYSDKLMTRNSTRMDEIVVNAKFRNQDTLAWDEPLDFDFDLKLTADYMERIVKNDKLVSHFLKVQRFEHYAQKVKKYHLTWRSFSDVKIINVTLDQLEDSIIYVSKGNYSILHSQTELMLSVGPFYPFKLEYQKTDGKIKLGFLGQNVPPTRDSESKEDFSFSSGIVNQIQSGRSNERLVHLLNKLKQNPESALLSVYISEAPFLCNEIEFLDLQELSYGKEHSLTNDTLNTATSTSGNTLNKSNGQNLLKSLKKNLDLTAQSALSQIMKKMCRRFYLDNEDHLKRMTYFQLDTLVSQQVIPSVFINLIGKHVNLQFGDSQEAKRALDTGTTFDEGHQKLRLAGKVVLADSKITGTGDEKELFALPTQEEVKTMENERYLPMLDSGLYCGSISPYYPISSSSLKRTFDKRANAVENDDFYYISVTRTRKEDNEILISLYTNAENPTNEFRFHNKRRSVTLQKRPIQNMIIKMNDLDHQKLSIYQGYAKDTKLGWTGLYMMLFRKDEQRPSFDCFLNSSIGNVGVKTEFMIYHNIRKQATGHDDHKPQINARAKDSKEQSVLSMVFLLGFVSLIFGAIVWYFVFGGEKIVKEDLRGVNNQVE